jgi:NDP-sugar pyrophosphorylase family protein
VAVADGAHSAGRVVPPAIVEQGCEIGEGAHVGSLVVLGRDVAVGAHSRIERCVVLEGARIGEGCELTDCIVAPGVTVGDGTVIAGGAVLGEGVRVGSGNVLSNGVKVFPRTELGDGAIRF